MNWNGHCPGIAAPKVTSPVGLAALSTEDSQTPSSAHFSQCAAIWQAAEDAGNTKPDGASGRTQNQSVFVSGTSTPERERARLALEVGRPSPHIQNTKRGRKNSRGAVRKMSHARRLRELSAQADVAVFL